MARPDWIQDLGYNGFGYVIDSGQIWLSSVGVGYSEPDQQLLFYSGLDVAYDHTSSYGPRQANYFLLFVDQVTNYAL